MPERRAMWGDMTYVLGELPAVLSAYRAKQSADVVPHSAPGLHTGKAGSGQVPMPNPRCAPTAKPLTRRNTEVRLDYQYCNHIAWGGGVMFVGVTVY